MRITGIVICLIISLFAAPLFAQQNQGAIDMLLNDYAASDWTTGAVARADLDTIVRAGLRAPSARNLQPWHFIVVQSQELARRVLPQTTDGNVFIVVTAAGDGRTNGVQILDSALAVHSINLAAQSLGYGARIYTAHNERINNTLKADLGFPEGHSIVALVRIGRIRSRVDGISGASSRRPQEEKVTYK